MSNPQPQPQGQQFTVLVAALTAALVAGVAAFQTGMILKFAALIAQYKGGDLLLHKLRAVSKSTAAAMQLEIPSMVFQVIDRAVVEGSQAGEASVAAAGGIGGPPAAPLMGLAGDTFDSHAQRSAQAIRDDLVGKLNGLSYRITRFADDTYRAVTADAAISQVLGLTPAQAQHDAYQKLMANGVDGFTDSRGRNWELSAYVDMAVRTAAQRAYNVAHLDRMQALGINYFVVSDDGHPCPLCAPWQGVVLTAGIPDEIAQHTVEEATAAGLFHPRCRHVLTAFIPGATVVPPPHVWDADDQRKYDESQQQRALERQIRAAKRQLDAAFTPEMKTAAAQKVRQAQANMRDFIDRTGRVRNSRREQLHL